jgi:hypothetical protein
LDVKVGFEGEKENCLSIGTLEEGGVTVGTRILSERRSGADIVYFCGERWWKRGPLSQL